MSRSFTFISEKWECNPLPLPKDVARPLYPPSGCESGKDTRVEATVNYFRRRGCPVHPVTHVIPVPTVASFLL